MINVYNRLARLFEPPPEVRGQVGSVDSAAQWVWVILPSGGRLRARGVAQVGDWVYVKGGQITGISPALPGIDQEI